MIDIIGLSKSYGTIEAVKNVSFSVNKNEILGFLGPNGAGKSTTMNIITGFIPSSSGTVEVCGYDILEEPKEAKKRMGYTPELPPLYLDMTVIDYLNFVADLKRLPRKGRKSHLGDIMDLIGIGHVQKRLIGNLSKGYRQRVGLSQSLIGRPEVLILDEPTVGLDPKQIVEIRKLIKSLGKDHTIILSTHILPEVSAVCDRVVIINKGEIAAIDTPENLSKEFTNSSKFTIRIAGPRSQTKNILKSIYGVRQVDDLGQTDAEVCDFLVESSPDAEVRKPIFFELARHGYPILELKGTGLSLEEIFVQVVTQEKGVEQQ